MITINKHNDLVSSNPEFEGFVKKLESGNLDFVKKRLQDQHNWKESGSEQARLDFLRFMSLTKLVKEQLVPSVQVDEFWHSFILFTKEYKSWCENNWGDGEFLHHQPGHKEDDGTWERTCQLMHQVYGVEWAPKHKADSCYTPPPQTPSSCWSPPLPPPPPPSKTNTFL